MGQFCQTLSLARLPEAGSLLDRGLITEHHARSLAEATASLDDVTAAKLAKAVLGRAPQQKLADFRRAIRRAVLKLAPKPAEQRSRSGSAALLTYREGSRVPDAGC